MEVGDRKQLVYSHILEAVSSSPKAGFLMVGYDDLYAIQYFKDNRMAYWKHNGKKISGRHLKNQRRNIVRLWSAAVISTLV